MGIRGENPGNMNIYNSLITNCYFRYGFIPVIIYGLKQYTIQNTKFIGNLGNNGPIINILEYSDDYIINFNFCIFENNHAYNYGGIVYSHKYYTENFVPIHNHYYFNDCVFVNNTARKGILI